MQVDHLRRSCTYFCMILYFIFHEILDVTQKQIECVSIITSSQLLLYHHKHQQQI